MKPTHIVTTHRGMNSDGNDKKSKLESSCSSFLWLALQKREWHLAGILKKEGDGSDILRFTFAPMPVGEKGLSENTQRGKSKFLH